MSTLHYLDLSPENIYITFESWHHCNDIQVLGDRHNFSEAITKDERIADKLFIREEDEEGNRLPDDECRIEDCDGYTLLSGVDAIEAATGCLDMGDYDFEVKRLDECDGEYLDALEVECDHLYYSDEILAYIAHRRGEGFVDAYKLYRSNMTIFFADGGSRDICVENLEWCDDEDDVYDVLREEFNLCEFSAREISQLPLIRDWWGRHTDEYEE